MNHLILQQSIPSAKKIKNNFIKSTSLVTATISSAVGLCFGIITQASAGTIVYSNDFTTGSGYSEWSNNITTTAPSGERFLGRFSSSNKSATTPSGTTTLTLPIPTRTTNISLAFDLYIIHSWDGNGNPADPIVGPDNWRVQIIGNPNPLLQATFNNVSGLAPISSRTQSFGGQNQPLGDYPARTGAFAIDTLGIESGFVWGSRDSTYRFFFTFPYTQSSLSINFSDLGLQGLIDESWGLDNIVISSDANNPSPVGVPEPSNILGLGLLGLGLAATKVKSVLSKKTKSPTDKLQEPDS
ncbi:MAG: PEP-CTERM sorting domain-containing protein [Microcystis aeruginosa F13-15]|nr:PEP-CTERM sorting domain-containing protein [Microcystis aeruginosa F13-15]